ncbi:hypothetical protein [Acetilactobacillus jinshanensis]|uniref:Uncharacterized protein n=1 Tax=Acetilactobacillus jinshanensis TaxID=1720083 RepID=A0A4P6ZL78_9LACO|nr:hypothetical protein [Acetilactobacillus jinshanensis]QBP18287.1 hypothetical protein ELX58_03865 [Acetilactobacillus jinshanensis]URL61151.1 hypothetical protein HGK75_03920 [uncultured bacterium]
MKESLNKTRDAKLSSSDKITNFREALESYGLQDQLKGYYTAKQIMDNFKADLSSDQVQKMQKLANPRPLDGANLFVVTSDHKVRPVNDDDVKAALNSTLQILKKSDK